jgi:hypothetical protein
MNVGIWTVAAQFLSWEYLFRIFGIVSLQCTHHNILPSFFNLTQLIHTLAAIPRYILNTVDWLLLLCAIVVYFVALYVRNTDAPEAKFIIPDRGDVVDSGIRLTLSPQSGTMNLGYREEMCRAGKNDDFRPLTYTLEGGGGGHGVEGQIC